MYTFIISQISVIIFCSGTVSPPILLAEKMGCQGLLGTVWQKYQLTAFLLGRGGRMSIATNVCSE
jgi:hypothetical protein